MARSNWKGPYLSLETLRQYETKRDQIYPISRKATILASFVGQTFKIHNGKKYIELTVTEEMVNHKFGEFSQTRARFEFKKNKK